MKRQNFFFCILWKSIIKLQVILFDTIFKLKGIYVYMRQKGTESDRDREGKMTLVVKAMADTVAGSSFTLDWEYLDKNRFKWGRPWLCIFWEKHFLSRGVGLGFHCGHTEASLCLILLPCFIRLRGCCFLVFFIIFLKRVDAVKPGGNPPFLAKPV